MATVGVGGSTTEACLDGSGRVAGGRGRRPATRGGRPPPSGFVGMCDPRRGVHGIAACPTGARGALGLWRAWRTWATRPPGKVQGRHSPMKKATKASSHTQDQRGQAGPSGYSGRARAQRSHETRGGVNAICWYQTLRSLDESLLRAILRGWSCAFLLAFEKRGGHSDTHGHRPERFGLRAPSRAPPRWGRWGATRFLRHSVRCTLARLCVHVRRRG